MKLYISADIEGISGIATWEQARTEGADYARARGWMTDDVNAAIEGALEGGITEVVVRDAHAHARNIQWDRLHPRARLITGWDAKIDMMLGCDASFAVAFLIGYHPGPGVPEGVLSHCFTRRILDIRLNGNPCDEAVIAALQAGSHGVPIGLVTGQEELWPEIEPSLEETLFVSTKKGMAYQAALLEPMGAVRQTIHDAAKEAASRASRFQSPAPFAPEGPLKLEIELTTVEAASAIDGIEGVERVSAGGCVVAGDSAPVLLRRFFQCLQVLYAVKDAP